MRSVFCLIGLVILAAAWGCENAPSPAQRVPANVPSVGESGSAPTEPHPVAAAPAASVENAAPVPTPPGASSPAAAGAEASHAPPEAAASPPQQSTAASSPPPASPPPVREKAEAGVGVRGDKIGGGIYATPARAYFQIREKAAFIQVEHALNLFRGLEGRLPRSHEEFMEKVIQANQIQLPQLAEGSRYMWDPQKGELMVERPR